MSWATPPPTEESQNQAVPVAERIAKDWDDVLGPQKALFIKVSSARIARALDRAKAQGRAEQRAIDWDEGKPT